MRWRLAGVLAFALVTSGCVGLLGDDPARAACPAPNLSVFHPGAVGSPVPRATGEAAPILVWAENPTDATVKHVTTTLPAPRALLDPNTTEGPRDRPISHEVDPGERSFAAVLADEPTVNRSVRLQVDLATDAPVSPGGQPCELTGANSTDVALAEPVEPDQRAEPGKGVLVRTVGWWTNGTSFYTNHQRYHDEDLPQGYLGPFDGSEPLKVYVYNESGDEMPERYNESGYVTTIPGFNEALKGIPTVGGRLAYLEPDQAYTRDGYEEHPLYGDPLVFYIEAVEVRSVPCEVPQPVCMPPDEGDLPPGPFHGP